MSVFLKTNEDPETIYTGTPYYEKDWGIVRDVTRFKLDFSNPECLDVGAGEDIVYGTPISNLVYGGTTSSLGGHSTLGKLDPLVNGTVTNDNAGGGTGTDPKFTFTSDLSLVETDTQFLLIAHMAIEDTGIWEANQFMTVAGVSGDGGAAQWVLWLHSDVNGNIDSLRLRVRGESSPTNNIDSDLTDPSVIATLTDGDLHQVAVHGQIGSGSFHVVWYVDGEQVSQDTRSTTSTVFLQTMTNVNGTVFDRRASGVSVVMGGDRETFRLGPISLHVPNDNYDADTLIERDAQAAAGYVS